MTGLPANISKVHIRLKRLGRDVSGGLGMGSSFFNNARGARILVYHGVCLRDPLSFNTLFVTLKTLESHIKLYQQHFNIISLDDMYERRFDEKKFNICLTFDDGFANNYNYVLPLLEQYKVPATFFVTGIRDTKYDVLWNDVLSIAGKYGPVSLTLPVGRFSKEKGRYLSIEDQTPLPAILRSAGFEEKAEMIRILYPFIKNAEEDYWLQMTRQQISGLAASSWATIGCHGYYHNDLASILLSAAVDEMKKSKAFLEETTGKEIRAFAFPYGSYTRAVVDEAKKLGFSQILATEFIFPEDQHDTTMNERLTINPFISAINQAHANITGTYQ